MLVLSRRVSQRIFIGDDIVIAITEIDGGKVKVGIEAPRDVRIEREEVRIWRQKEEIRTGRFGP